MVPRRHDPGGRTSGWRGGALGGCAAVTAVLVLGACAATADGPAPADGGQGPSAPPSTPEAYRKALGAAVKPLDVALAALAKTGPYGALTGRMATAEQAAPRALSDL